MEYTYKYPRPAVTADCVVITREAGVLGIPWRIHEYG